MSQADRFLKACRRERTDCTPIWLMRQAGPHLPRYRKLLKKHGLMEIMKTPELAIETARMPVDAFGVDAAIVCSDVLVMLEGMGLQLNYNEGHGGIIENPISSHADIESLIMSPSAEPVSYVLTNLRQTAKELHGIVPVIGFSGAPFTLASYAITGSRPKHYKKVKELMYGDRVWWHKLMEKLVRQLSDFMIAQVKAGAKAIQLFDSWVGTLSPYDFREFVLPHTQRLINSIREACPSVPIISFGTRGSAYLPLFREAGGDVIGIDWRIDLLEAWDLLGSDVAVQGNLDPSLLLGPEKEMLAQTARLLDAVNGRQGHVMNLGHGVFKETSPKTIEALVEFVHSHTSNGEK